MTAVEFWLSFARASTTARSHEMAAGLLLMADPTKLVDTSLQKSGNPGRIKIRRSEDVMRLHRLKKDTRETVESEICEDDGRIGALFKMGKGSQNKKIFFASFDWSDVEALIEAFGKAGTLEAKKLLQSRRLAASLGARTSRRARPARTPRPDRPR